MFIDWLTGLFTFKPSFFFSHALCSGKSQYAVFTLYKTMQKAEALRKDRGKRNAPDQCGFILRRSFTPCHDLSAPLLHLTQTFSQKCEVCYKKLHFLFKMFPEKVQQTIYSHKGFIDGVIHYFVCPPQRRPSTLPL